MVFFDLIHHVVIVFREPSVTDISLALVPLPTYRIYCKWINVFRNEQTKFT